MMTDLWYHRHPKHLCRSVGRIKVTVVFLLQGLNIKLTTAREQATTVENNVHTSEEIAKAYEQKNKVRMKTVCELLIISCFSLVAGFLRT